MAEFDCKGIVYSSGNVHIPVQTAASGIGCLVKPDRGIVSITHDEAQSFVKDGLCTIEQAVDQRYVIACKSYIDENWKKWFSKTKRTDDWR